MKYELAKKASTLINKIEYLEAFREKLSKHTNMDKIIFCTLGIDPMHLEFDPPKHMIWFVSQFIKSLDKDIANGKQALKDIGEAPHPSVGQQYSDQHGEVSNPSVGQQYSDHHGEVS